MGSAKESAARAFARCAAAALAVVTLSQSPHAVADDYPNRAVTMIVPWPAGGAVDTLVRAVTPKLAERLGKAIVVENRPGAGSTLGTAAAAKAAPDGYTLGVPGSGSLTIGPTMYKKLPYDPLKDFEHIALIGRVPFVLVVNPALPVQSLPDLIKYAKEKPL
ncbi:MAG: tripartite tricarboxylate transporter substrate-binding protein, partial [Pseudomonadota bacterium]